VGYSDNKVKEVNLNKLIKMSIKIELIPSKILIHLTLQYNNNKHKSVFNREGVFR